MLGRLSRTLGDLDGARRWLELAHSQSPQDADARIELAALAVECGRVDEVDALLTTHPITCAELLAARAQWLAASGRLGEAESCLRRLLEQRPRDAGAFHGLSMLPGATLGEEDARTLHSILEDGTDRRSATQALLALARRAERAGHHQAAFSWYCQAKDRQRRGLPSSREAYGEMFHRHGTWQARQFLRHLEPLQGMAVRPIWIIGMPRSGTSLAEQMLDAHPRICGLGEVEYVRLLVEALEEASGLRFPAGLGAANAAALRQAAELYLSRLTQRAHGAAWVIDKLPHNFLRAGILGTLFPEGIFVHCKRNPVANCWSIFSHEFSDGHCYATDLAALGDYYRHYEALLAGWRELLGERLIEVQLETLVEDPRGALSPVFAAIGLDWQERCAKPEANPRPVFTPSAVAIRQQPDRARTDHYRHYLPWLTPLTAALQGS